MERFWLQHVPTTQLFSVLLRKSIFHLFTTPALYITLTNTLTHKDKDRETESEKEQRAETTSLLLGFFFIAVS